MNHKIVFLSLRIFATALLSALSATLHAQPTGILEGRVFNAATGSVLAHARVSIEGTNREARTDEDGTFHIVNVPAGDQRATISYLGFDPQTITVGIPAGASVRRDVDLTRGGAAAAGEM